MRRDLIGVDGTAIVIGGAGKPLEPGFWPGFFSVEARCYCAVSAFATMTLIFTRSRRYDIFPVAGEYTLENTKHSDGGRPWPDGTHIIVILQA